MTIPHTELIIIAVGSIGSVSSFLICLSYPLIERLQNKKKRRKDVSLTIDGETINAEITPKEAEKILRILGKCRPNDTRVEEHSVR